MKRPAPPLGICRIQHLTGGICGASRFLNWILELEASEQFLPGHSPCRPQKWGLDSRWQRSNLAKL
jgi:hypothetical protein